MKEKFKAFFSREEPYYSYDEKNGSKKSDVIHLTPEKELKMLRKENDKLHKDFLTQTLESVKSRRSVRSFSDAKIDFKTIYDIISASLNAPAAGNIQNYNIILVRDDALKKEVGKIALNQSWMAEAPIIAVVVRDDVMINQMYPQHGGRYSLQNTAAFITTFLNLIHSAGYASCWVEACEEEVMKELLSIPSTHAIDAILPLGFPMDIPKVQKTSYEDSIFFEKYGNNQK